MCLSKVRLKVLKEKIKTKVEKMCIEVLIQSVEYGMIRSR